MFKSIFNKSLLCAMVISLAFYSCKNDKLVHEITIEANNPGPKIDPLLYGIFFEELDFAGDGGLYAELVRNGSFEKNQDTSFWSLIQEKAKGKMAINSTNLLNKVQKKCLEITVLNINGGRVAAANKGYFGIHIEKDTVYKLSFFARVSKNYKGSIIASLEDSSCMKNYGSVRIESLSSEWKKYTTEIKASATSNNATFVLALDAQGSVCFDVISLFPPTFKNRPNGFRCDLIKKLIDLKPAFMRFPGGCYVQGYGSVEQAFDWKKSIGSLENREGMNIMWSYYATVGMGYHEMLQLSEDIGAEPIFVVNCGQTMTFSMTDKETSYWLQSALDAIEYANGPITGKWGALRAAAGHPEPFNLKLIAVGNEDAVPRLQNDYSKHYALFTKTIKEKYPYIKFIQSVNHLTDDPKWNGQPADYVDHHYYRSPSWFFNKSNKFDSYPRNEPRLFISELASLSGDVGEGNLWGAIGEASFMTGLERNADVVGLACYAPLFRNVNWRNWNPNMILFNNNASFGIPSYYLWQMFMHNTGDVYIPSTVSNNVDTLYPTLEGKMGVGSWATKVEFDSIRITYNGNCIKEDFEDISKTWKPKVGTWEIKNGTYKQLEIKDGCESILQNEINSGNYTIELKAKKISGKEGFLVIFGLTPKSKFTWNIGGWENSRSSLMCNSDFLSGEIGTPVKQSIETNRWYSIKIVIENNNHILCYLDGKLEQDYFVEPQVSHSVFASVNKVSNTNELIIKLVNTTDKIREASIHIEGVSSFEGLGTLTVLTSKNKTDENSFDNPNHVIPNVKPINNLSTSFKQELAPYSVSIIRAKAKFN